MKIEGKWKLPMATAIWLIDQATLHMIKPL